MKTGQGVAKARQLLASCTVAAFLQRSSADAREVVTVAASQTLTSTMLALTCAGVLGAPVLDGGQCVGWLDVAGIVSACALPWSVRATRIFDGARALTHAYHRCVPISIKRTVTIFSASEELAILRSRIGPEPGAPGMELLAEHLEPVSLGGRFGERLVRSLPPSSGTDGHFLYRRAIK
jgi:hypothetical protein